MRQIIICAAIAAAVAACNTTNRSAPIAYGRVGAPLQTSTSYVLDICDSLQAKGDRDSQAGAAGANCN